MEKEYWLLTNTFYGNWLPGDRRGSYTDVSGQMALTEPQPRLARHAQQLLKGAPTLLTRPQAEVLMAQLQETATHRGWQLLAAAIMANHVHLVVVAAVATDPQKMLNDFKAYGTRALNREFGRPTSDRWWTLGGSKRKLPEDGEAIPAAVNYVLRKQPDPLVVWDGTSPKR